MGPPRGKRTLVLPADSSEGLEDIPYETIQARSICHDGRLGDVLVVGVCRDDIAAIHQLLLDYLGQLERAVKEGMVSA